MQGRIQFNPSSGVRDVDRLEVHQYRYVDQGKPTMHVFHVIAIYGKVFLVESVWF